MTNLAPARHRAGTRAMGISLVWRRCRPGLLVIITPECPRCLFLTPYSLICPHVSLQEGHFPRRVRRVWCTTQVGLAPLTFIRPPPPEVGVSSDPPLQRYLLPQIRPKAQGSQVSLEPSSPPLLPASLVGMRQGAYKVNPFPLIPARVIGGASL